MPNETKTKGRLSVFAHFGIELLAASQRMTAAARDGLSAIQSRIEQPNGRLTVTIATPAAQSPLSDILSDFVRLYPGIQVSFHIGDDNLNLEGSNFDVAIRGMMTDHDDSGYIAIKLGQIEFGAFASAKYAQNRPVPRTVDDLADWDRISQGCSLISSKTDCWPLRYLAECADRPSLLTRPYATYAC